MKHTLPTFISYCNEAIWGNKLLVNTQNTETMNKKTKQDVLRLLDNHKECKLFHGGTHAWAKGDWSADIEYENVDGRYFIEVNQNKTSFLLGRYEFNVKMITPDLNKEFSVLNVHRLHEFLEKTLDLLRQKFA